jgi:hypothetical protein
MVLDLRIISAFVSEVKVIIELANRCDPAYELYGEYLASK